MTLNSLPRNYWTVERIREEAAKYSTRGDFYKYSKSAYNAASRLKLLDDLLEPREIKWTTKKITEEAQKYTTREEFRKEAGSAYVAAWKKDLLDKLIPRERTQWSLETVREEAQKYSSRVEFQKGSPGAYNKALREGIVAELIPDTFSRWTKEAVALEAQKFSNRRSFYTKHVKAYRAAQFLGVLDEICSHMEFLHIPSDCVYFWKAGRDLFKVGVTSHHRGNDRIREVARHIDLDPEFIVKTRTAEPYKVEREILKIGAPAVYEDPFDRSTEFRLWNNNELNQAMRLILCV